MEHMTEKGDGCYAYVDDLDEATKSPALVIRFFI
jgi:hypothetical protein